ncbi:MAG: aminoacetone oxidase family FAD-binding enzyme, partial [Ruminococcus sp.]|nr:aminoacetone oxidase family FAD-binding enzyme [Ruminococcus sp.]
MYDVIAVGGGAAGMTAAISAAESGADVLLIEKNDRMGKKLAITGKGRCNVTNNCGLDTLMENIPNNGKFLYSALSQWLPADTMAFFESMGVPLKTERGRRVFPVSDKAADIVNALTERLGQLGVETVRGNVRSLIVENGVCSGVNTHERQFRARAVILATGGMSYPKTGSDGYGYRLAERAGHTIIPPRPSLSALVTEETWVGKARGLTLKNASVKLLDGGKTVYEDFGELTFTADGIGGATVLSASAHIAEMAAGRYAVTVDMKPALSEKQLDARILRDFAELRGGAFAQSLRKLLPGE